MVGAQWQSELQDRGAQARWLLSIVTLGAAMIGFQQFLTWVERRAGVVLPDPILTALPAMDLTWPIFLLVYGGVATSLIALRRWPDALRVTLLAYGLMVGFRLLMMAVTPLDPPPRMLPLKDPFIAMLGVEGVPTRDLFFSGHTATLALLGFAVPQRSLRITLFAATAAMGVMVLLQQVHYTVDVLVAPFVAYAALALARFTASGSAREARGSEVDARLED